MFRMWAKIIKSNHILKDICLEDGSADTRTHKVFHTLNEVCHKFDLATPIWLDINISDFKRYNKTRFTRDSFIASILIIWKFRSSRKIDTFFPKYRIHIDFSHFLRYHLLCKM